MMRSCRSSSFQPFPPLPPPPPPLACSPPRAACLAWISASFSFCNWAFTSCTCSEWGAAGNRVIECQDVCCPRFKCSCVSSPPHLLLHSRLASVFGARGQEFIERLQAGDEHRQFNNYTLTSHHHHSRSGTGEMDLTRLSPCELQSVAELLHLLHHLHTVTFVVRKIVPGL